MIGLTVHPSTSSGRTVKPICSFVKGLLNDYLAVELDAVIGGDDEVVAVLLVAAMPGEFEQSAHAQATGVAVAGAAFEFGAALLHAAADKILAVADFDVAAGVVELLVARVGMGHFDDGLDPQVGLGLLEVVVGQRMGAGLDFPAHRPCVEVVGSGLVGAAGFGVVGDFFVSCWPNLAT